MAGKLDDMRELTRRNARLWVPYQPQLAPYGRALAASLFKKPETPPVLEFETACVREAGNPDRKWLPLFRVPGHADRWLEGVGRTQMRLGTLCAVLDKSMPDIRGVVVDPRGECLQIPRETLPALLAGGPADAPEAVELDLAPPAPLLGDPADQPEGSRELMRGLEDALKAGDSALVTSLLADYMARDGQVIVPFAAKVAPLDVATAGREWLAGRSARQRIQSWLAPEGIRGGEADEILLVAYTDAVQATGSRAAAPGTDLVSVRLRDVAAWILGESAMHGLVLDPKPYGVGVRLDADVLRVLLDWMPGQPD